MFSLTRKETEESQPDQQVGMLRLDIPESIADIRFCMLSAEYTECKGSESVRKIVRFIESIGDFMRIMLIPAMMLLAVGLSSAEMAHPGSIMQFHDTFWAVVN